MIDEQGVESVHKHNLYIKHSSSVYTPGNRAIKKINPEGTSAWMTALLNYPNVKSLCVDTTEQHVYVASFTYPLDVTRLGTDTGAIVDAQRHSFLNGQSYGIKIHLLSDGSGYYVTGDSADRANICKYKDVIN